jgi:hypothetical protein
LTPFTTESKKKDLRSSHLNAKVRDEKFSLDAFYNTIKDLSPQQKADLKAELKAKS